MTTDKVKFPPPLSPEELASVRSQTTAHIGGALDRTPDRKAGSGVPSTGGQQPASESGAPAPPERPKEG